MRGFLFLKLEYQNLIKLLYKIMVGNFNKWKLIYPLTFWPAILLNFGGR